jgi:hypothetical protein
MVNESARSLQVPALGLLVVSVAPEAVVGSVAASNALAVTSPPPQRPATIRQSAWSVVIEPVVAVTLEAPAVALVAWTSWILPLSGR